MKGPLGKTGTGWRMSAAVLLIAALVWFLFFHRLADRDLWGSHEARAGQDAGSMLHYRDWSLPRLTDETADLQKPPMYYWLVAATAWASGSLDESAIRLPAAISATLTAFALGLVLFCRGRRIAALIAPIILITSQHFTWLARTARIDMPLTLCITVAVLTIGLTRRWQIVGFLAIAAAVLLKGPVGLVLPLAVIVGDRILERFLNGERLGWRSLAWGLPLVAALTLPWFVAANEQTHGQFFHVFFWHHNFERAMGGSAELAVHPWWYYGPRLIADALPWSALLVPAIAFLITRRPRLGTFVSSPSPRLCGKRVGVRSQTSAIGTQNPLTPPLPPQSRGDGEGGGGSLAANRAGPRLGNEESGGALAAIPSQCPSIWRLDREARLGLLWLITIPAVLSCAKFKRADYILPAHPGMAMLLGCLGERLWFAARPSLRRALALGMATIVAATVMTWGYVIHVELPKVEPGREQRTFARAIREVAPAPAEVLFFRVECHALAFHLGRPINSLLEWENLDWWAGRPRPTYIVMSPEDSLHWQEYLTAGALEEVFRNTDFSGGKHERPLVLMRTRPKVLANHGSSREQAADIQGLDLHGIAGPESSRAGGASRTGVGDGSEQARPPVRNPSRG